MLQPCCYGLLLHALCSGLLLLSVAVASCYDVAAALLHRLLDFAALIAAPAVAAAGYCCHASMLLMPCPWAATCSVYALQPGLACHAYMMQLAGKAAYGMMKDMAENPKKWEGRNILFIHTGGLLGLFDKTDQMESLVGNWRKMDIDDDSIPCKNGTGN
ncbi:D-cysteine desulfhydrase [Actinidia rufa]|uniref:D-cysteine desulfhydrase n=1 Tax=Actinidia rufa TaxID=165716 RepID=A0A7J0FJR9_9ERIC|nr:D-cysteine desulfhydrase [Actinidia rufa]